MKIKIFTLATILSLTLSNITYSKENVTTQPASTSSATLPRAKSVKGAKVFIKEPANGAIVSNPIAVKFGIEGMELAPAGGNRLMLNRSGNFKF